MSKKTIYLTLDTETVGGCFKPEGIYNLGGLIHDRDGNILSSFNFIIGEHYNKILEKAHYGKKNFSLYEEMLKNGNTSMVSTEREALDLVKNLIKLYNVRYVMAYNSEFDLTRTNCKKLVEDTEFIDILKMVSEIYSKRPSYKKYCKENGFMGKNNHPKTSVETFYGFITDNPQFEEEHTAFSDAKQEMEIFVKCAKAHKPYTKNCHQFNSKKFEKTIDN